MLYAGRSSNIFPFSEYSLYERNGPLLINLLVERFNSNKDYMQYVANRTLSKEFLNELNKIDINDFSTWIDKLICLWAIQNIYPLIFDYKLDASQEKTDIIAIIYLAAVFVTNDDYYWNVLPKALEQNNSLFEKLKSKLQINIHISAKELLGALQHNKFTLYEMIELTVECNYVTQFNVILQLLEGIEYLKKYQPVTYKKWCNNNPFYQTLGLIDTQHEEYVQQTKTFHEEYRSVLDNYHELFSSFSDIYYKMEQQLDEIKTKKTSLNNNTKSTVSTIESTSIQNIPEIIEQPITEEDYWFNQCQTLYPAFYDDLKQATYKETYELCCDLTTVKNTLGLPMNIRELYQCHELDLSNKGYYNLPDAFSCLNNLQVLDLSNNNFSIIPDAVTKLKNIKHLVLKLNMINDLTNVIKMTTLTHLVLNYNQIKIIPDNMAQLTNLEVLNLANNDIRTLSIELCEMKNLKALIIKGNPIKEIPKPVRHLIFYGL